MAVAIEERVARKVRGNGNGKQFKLRLFDTAHKIPGYVEGVQIIRSAH